MDKPNKKQLAQILGISRQLLYYEHKLPKKDWKLKSNIERVLREHPSYGHKRLALHLRVNKKRILRVMKKFGIKPYRRRGKKYRYIKQKPEIIYPNLLLKTYPKYPHHIWASDFTHIWYKNKWIYLATIMDLFTIEMVGFNILTNHSVQLTINALLSAILNHPIPQVLHSDQGSEYTSKDYISICQKLLIQQSMSNKGCPWENGYQESFYDKFKIDMGDPSRFETLGELVYNIYQTIYKYNHSRLHLTLKMPPIIFAKKYQFNNLAVRKCV